MNFKFTKVNYIDNILIVEPKIFDDSRGHFFESFKESEFKEIGITQRVIQSNQSRSSQNVVRGLHFQNPPYSQAKLVRCLSGKIYDVAVDIRKNSKSYGKYFGIELSSDNKKMLYIPHGFAHGFSVLSETAEVFYDVFGSEYNKSSEGGIRFDDPDLDINWQLESQLVSDKDLELTFLKELKSEF